MPGGTDLACAETTKRLGKRWPSRTGSDRPRSCQVIVLADPDKWSRNRKYQKHVKYPEHVRSRDVHRDKDMPYRGKTVSTSAVEKITDLSMARITDWSIARRKQISTFQSSLYGEPHLTYARHYVLTRTIFHTAHHSRCFLYRQIQQKDYIQLPTWQSVQRNQS